MTPTLRVVASFSMFCVTLCPGQLDAEATRSLSAAADRWLAADPDARPALDPALDAHLREHPDDVRGLIWERFRSTASSQRARADFDEKRVRSGELVSPYTLKTVGARPQGGWPLFIAMHGGGGVPKRVNDSQWKIMQRYYRDQSSVDGYLYLALRAPTDQWNGFYTSYIYPLIQKLVNQFLLFGDVDPDRVFIMGYSHGGYGAFAIGPTMPDLFAAVHSSAAAPTGGQSCAENLMNTRFTYMIGEKDTAYGRATRCKDFAARITALREDHQDLYPVVMEWQAGRGHGGLPDRDKIKDMYPFRRTGAPRQLWWRMTCAEVGDHFWLHSPTPSAGQSVRASSVGSGKIELKTENVDKLELWLDERLTDVDKPVTVSWDGTESEHPAPVKLHTLLETLAARGDIRRAATRRVVLSR